METYEIEQSRLGNLKRQAVALATRIGDAYDRAWFAGGEIASDPTCQKIVPILRQAHARAQRRDRADYALYCAHGE